MKVYGPYTRKSDGRKQVYIVYPDGRKRTVSYPKYIMEQKLGRELDPNLETINHIDGDFNNNSDDNLEILARKDHARKDAIRLSKVKICEFVCGVCKKTFERRLDSKLRWSLKRSRGNGPFCSKRCAGRASHM